MKNYDGIIFDIDGTLTSTNELIFASFRFVSNKYLEKNFSDEEIIKLFGPTEDVILKEWGGENYPNLRQDYYNFYSQNHNMADLYPGIKDILDYIKSKDVLLSIYTGKGKEATTITLKKLGIYDYFDMIMTGDDVKDHKPSPEGVTNFLDKFNLNKDRVLMIGDSPADIRASRASGIKVASVVWDSYAKDEVLEIGSNFLFHTVIELDQFIRENV